MPGLFERLAALFGGVEADAPVPSTALPAPETAPVRPTLSADDPRLPDASRPGVARLLALAGEIEARGARDPLLAGAVTEARQMRDQHLPQLIAAYADIPPAHRAEIFRATGKSASFKLNEAIERMVAKAERLSRSMAEEDINSFSDHLRFIDQRYGEEPDPFG